MDGIDEIFFKFLFELFEIILFCFGFINKSERTLNLNLKIVKNS